MGTEFIPLLTLILEQFSDGVLILFLLGLQLGLGLLQSLFLFVKVALEGFEFGQLFLHLFLQF